MRVAAFLLMTVLAAAPLAAQTIVFDPHLDLSASATAAAGPGAATRVRSSIWSVRKKAG